MTMARLINTCKIVPKELFRINYGSSVRLRALTVKPKNRNVRYDLLTEAGKVKPKALNPKSYIPPNGASMHPNRLRQRELVTAIKGFKTIIYSVPAGTCLPDDLLLVHEFRDHYSLQAAKEMDVDELNTKITDFLTIHGKAFSKDQWLEGYPRPTETKKTHRDSFFPIRLFAYSSGQTPKIEKGSNAVCELVRLINLLE